ncbi:hypothetical protein [Bythopirellula polymerisocia]|uniref:PilZ domain-containing protein n=1 Tax=Bythopirellula polymerisocia TaxID=2528003 RepID=A0A5C6CZ87_9BACT|nr:hypothetical protein [Bythopirellula polymerisocia]TWU29245.1 hypothetical protein Pla144_00210 [Bythopirellula polymerisocia]
MVATTTPEPQTTNITCESCDVELPLLTTSQLDQASLWVCANCGANQIAFPDVDLLPEFGSLVRIHEEQFDTSDAPGIPAHIRVHLASIANRAVPQDVVNRRRSARVVNPMMISVIELDTSFVIAGKGLSVIMTDVSSEGAGLAMTDGTTAPYLALHIPSSSAKPIQIIARVVRQQALIPPYVAVGCEFMFRLGS